MTTVTAPVIRDDSDLESAIERVDELWGHLLDLHMVTNSTS
jgi:hypothetical protein